MSPVPDLTTASDQDLVARALEGHEQAYTELVRRYERSVHSLIYRIVRDREAANDLVQDTFVKAFEALDTFRPESSFSPWIIKIANNTALNYVRRTRLDPLALSPMTPGSVTPTALPLAERSNSAPMRVDRRALNQALDQAIGQLRDVYRECTILRHIEGRSYEDIAEILNLPVGTVKSRVHHARKKLRNVLGPLRDSLRGPSSATPA